MFKIMTVRVFKSIEDLVMNILEPLEFWKGWNEKGVHVELVLDHEPVEAPERVLVAREKHEEQRSDLGHALAIAYL